tara:strand:+ start:519 stop:1208 length:690 start_codon:yes stop_codon:yes gene_type:complete
MRLFDIKTNIIPRIDPNCDSISDSLKFLKEFKLMGLEKICSSPNYFDVGNNNLSDILINLQKEASKLENYDIPEIFLSLVYPLNNELKDFNKLVSINNSQFIYCKFPTNGIPINYEDFIRNLITNGYVPIITNITHCSLNENIKKINELFEYGCLFDIDIFDFHNFKSKKSISVIKHLEDQNSIITISGINKLDNIEKSFERFSKQTKIDLNKIKNLYCWDNPNLIISS